MEKKINLSTDFPTRWQEFTDAVTDGNQDVIESFITSVYESFYKAALGKLRILNNYFSVFELEDIVSESIEAVFLNLTKPTKNYFFESEKKLFGYILTICVHKAADYLKHYHFIRQKAVRVEDLMSDIDKMSDIDTMYEIEMGNSLEELKIDPSLELRPDFDECIHYDSLVTYIFRKNFGNHPKLEQYLRDDSKCVKLLCNYYVEGISYKKLLKTETYRGLQEANLRKIASRCIKKLRSLLSINKHTHFIL